MSFFKLSEFNCSDGCVMPKEIADVITNELIPVLDDIRTSYGHPLTVSSGYRCAKKQQELRDRGCETAVGVSQHELGKAADLVPPFLTDIPFLAACCRLHVKAIGQAKSFIHVDLRSDRERFWVYSKS